ncbi:MAG: MFS transporter [Eggerthellaceae bacterium]|jgi:MFS family permease
MSAAERAKKYMFAIAVTYMCYLTHGIQAIILSQNQVNFYTQWGYTDATAGAAAVSMAIVWTGVGKFVSVWAGGELSDRIGRKIPAVIGGILYIIFFCILLTTTDATVACVASFMAGLATSGFWDASLYPATQEADPKHAASWVIGIKFVISVSGIIYPLFAAMNSDPGSWHINIYIPIVMSIIATIMAIFCPFVYDDERKTKVSDDSDSKNKAEAEIQAAKDAMLAKPNALVNFITMFYGFVCMFIMYGAQQYTKQFGMTNCGLDPVAAAGLTSIYTVGSLVAVLFWAFMMGKLRWNPVKVVLIDSIISAVALAMVLLIHVTVVIYIAIALLGFGAAGGALQTGLIVRQNFHPGPKGRNVGIYYTFMGAGSVFLPLIVGSMTTAVGQGTAVWIMMVLLLAFSVLAILMMLYLVSQSKKLFGYSAMEKMPEE